MIYSCEKCRIGTVHRDRMEISGSLGPGMWWRVGYGLTRNGYTGQEAVSRLWYRAHIFVSLLKANELHFLNG